MGPEVSTIAALATAPAPAGIAVVRVSGPKTKTALRALFKTKTDPVADPRHLVFGEIIDYKTNEIIDTALAVFMPAPHSYTGEDVCEFQFHGSPVLVQKILRSLLAFGVSPAEAGEFTKRAFLNGKIDLTQAEAICDLINATSEHALKIAGEQLKGRFSQSIEQIGEPLRNSLAEIEANIDFPDEGIQPQALGNIVNTISAVREKLGNFLNSYAYGQVLRDGFRVLLCGRPNVGKSSLMNLLLGTERAIVTDISGTTRDVIEEQVVLGGFRFVLCDSAGIAETSDPVEAKGIELAKERIPWADIVLLVVDATDVQGEWQKTLQHIKGQAKKVWMLANKIDLNPQAFAAIYCDSKVCEQNFYLSVKTGDGIEALKDALIDEVRKKNIDAAQSSNVVTNERHRICLSSAEEALGRAIDAANRKLPLEIVSSEIRIALTALDEIIGKTYTEDILGRIFSKFCIGK